ncbi:MAG: PPOX class F420-dependent oxidoreductase [Candidatus Lambdaproteobacteria bacterium]|nr:PPOX class F420-dependent oxidoreductase [Candidatus Lambdaproteobacteria bacterium]
MDAGTPAGLGEARCISLATFRKDGREVRTPIWPVTLDGKVYVATSAASGKARRIRANGRARLAPCDQSGRKIQGPWIEARARQVSDRAVAARVEDLLRRKYGTMYWIMIQVVYRLRGLLRDRVAIEIELQPPIA